MLAPADDRSTAVADCEPENYLEDPAEKAEMPDPSAAERAEACPGKSSDA